jgi:hypothetical protein
MGIPMKQALAVGKYIVAQRLRRRTRYPLVLMLEPLFRCNLECAGCGKIQHPDPVLRQVLTPEQCWAASDECGAPVVSVAGGEPLLHPEIARIARGLVDRGRFVYLCTNALLLEKKLAQFEPNDHLSFNVHLDGVEARHDASVQKNGVHRIAVQAIRAAARASGSPPTRRSSSARTGGAAPVLRRGDGAGVEDDHLAGLRLRAGAGPGALPAPEGDARALPEGARPARERGWRFQPLAVLPRLPRRAS